MGEAHPQPGDIIIHRQIHSPAVYILSTLDGPLQVSFNTYEKAAIRALAFAREKHLGAWYTTDERRSSVLPNIGREARSPASADHSFPNRQRRPPTRSAFREGVVTPGR